MKDRHIRLILNYTAKETTMRIIKLSDKDQDMRDEKAVQSFFENYLPYKACPRGRFEITRGRIAKDGLSISEKLVFTYQSKLVYLGYAASEVARNTEPNNDTYPSFFLVDVQRIYPAQGTMQNFEETLRDKGLLKKNILNSQGWPRIEDSSELDKIWELFKAPKQADIFAGY
jgi:hypothetical protein